MKIAPLIETKAELTDGGLKPEPVVLSTRIRLARNLRNEWFPGWADLSQREKIFETTSQHLLQLEPFQSADLIGMDELSDLEKRVLVERRLVSRELTEINGGSGLLVTANQRIAIMINEEDHLRIQAVRSGLNFDTVWEEANQLDSRIEQCLDYAFDDDFGYLTACPTNLGTGLRASAMLHLPGLVIQEHMEKVVRMVNQLGMAVRGSLGEGSEATGSIFQISNQQTLGESEPAIIQRLTDILQAIIEQENNARRVLLEEFPSKLLDKIGRAYGILTNGHLLSSDEAMNLLSLMRLATDLGMLEDSCRSKIDRMMMDVQPGHVQYTAHAEFDAEQRDVVRATRLREQFREIGPLNFKVTE